MSAPKSKGPDYGVVYFYGDTGVGSLATTIDDSESMTEEHIAEYIKYSRPDVYDQLHGLRLTSSHIPLTFHGQRSLRRTADSENERVMKPLSDFTNQSCSAFQIEGASMQRGNERKTFIGRKLKEHIRDWVLAGEFLTLRCLSDNANLILCESPLCTNHNRIDRGKHYLELKSFAASSVSNQQSSRVTTKCYCLRCIEDLFDDTRELRANRPSRVTPQTASFDGINHEMVLEAATFLYPTYTNKSQDQKNEAPPILATDCAFKYPCNSSSALLLRRYKNKETEATLIEVAKYEKSKQASKMQVSPTDVNSPSLLITRMPYHEPRGERYKKQKLNSHGRKSIDQDQKGIKVELETPSPLDQKTTIRYCYCREIDEDSELIRCCSDWCPVGWFHFNCTGLRHVPTIGERFYCDYCSDDYGLFKACKLFPQLQHTASALSINDTVLPQELHMQLLEDILDDCGDSTNTTSMDSGSASDSESEGVNTSEMPVDKENIDSPASNNVDICVNEDTTQKLFVEPWGIAINKSYFASTKQQQVHASTFGKDEGQSEVESLASDQFDGVQTSIHNQVHHTTRFKTLNISQMRFSDLVPFIIAGRLTTSKLELFEAWKLTRPQSKLLPMIASGSIGSRDLEDVTELGQVEREALSIRLSDALGDSI